MPKTGFKTFVYSFLLSLFAIFGVNGVYWHLRPSAAQEIKIPRQNVMLFLRQNRDNPSTRPVPVKKIALSVLPELAAPEDAPPKDSRTVGSAVEEPEVIMADSDIIEIPLEINTYVPEETPRYKPREVKVVQNFDEVIHNPPPSSASEILGRRNSAAEKESKPQVAAREETADLVPEVAKPQPMPAAEPQAKEILLAEAEEPGTLFPLEKTNDPMPRQQARVRIAKTAEANRVALAASNVPIKSMTDNTAAKSMSDSKKKRQWDKLPSKKAEITDNTWAVAKAAVAPQNAQVMKERYYQADGDKVRQALAETPAYEGDEVQLAAGTIKNLLIPIPEDILNDENLTPQLVSSNKPEDIKKEIEVERKLNEEVRAEKPLLVKKEEPEESKKNLFPKTATPEQKKNNILNSLSSIFSSNNSIKESRKEDNDNFIGTMKKKFRTSKSRGKIMPTEMRLSFQPNRAEISGQTLRWIQAFAGRAAEDPSMSIEIRIDGTSAQELQQKRLNLLHNILTNKGVEYGQINTVFTNREPNSFIIRTIMRNNTNAVKTKGKMNNARESYYLQW